MTMVTAMVSPRARAKARNMEPMIPVRAQGTTTCHVASQRVAPKRHGGFALFARNGQQDFARNGNDEWDDHDGQHDSRSEKTHSVIRALKKRRNPRVVLSAGPTVVRISGTTTKIPSNP